MKTPQNPAPTFHHRAVLMTALAGFAWVCAASSSVSAAESDPKEHVLFVGTDLAVKEGEKFYKVVGAKKNSLIVEKDRQMADVRLGQGANIRVSRGVKLSSLSAKISDMKTESIDRESARAQLAAMQASMMLMDEAHDNEDRMHGRLTFLSSVAVYTGPNAPRGAAESAAKLEAARAAASAEFAGSMLKTDQIASAANTFLSDTLARTHPLDDEITFDASALPGLRLLGVSDLGDSSPGASASSSFVKENGPSSTTEVELSFNVSSPVPLDHAYLVVVANYSSPNKPDEAARQVSARQFAHIDSHPQRVKMRHAASINGLQFRKFDLALYANGQEVVTNLSEKRLALTNDQAFQFFLIDYLSKHKGATVPPTPMLMAPRPEFRRQLENVETNQTIYANVDKTGKVLAMSVDAAGTEPLPATLESTLRNVRFMPALEKGAPVDGRIKVTLAQLAK